VFCYQASAQQAPTVPHEATSTLAKDLANLQSEILAAQQQAAAQEAAQAKGARKTVEVTRNAEVLGGADPSAPAEFTALKGADFWVLDKQNGYYAVVRDDGKTGWIPASDVKPYFKNPMQNGDWDPWGNGHYNYKMVVANAPSVQERLFQTITESAVKFRDSYKNNPYFQVSGFTIVMGVTPSVDISFTFK
jgi:hypothetical protein